MTTRDERQAEIARWACEAFTTEQATSLPQRGLRLLEEAIESFQAAGGNPEQAHRLVDYVFSRPVGELGQELGGVGVCLLVFAAAAGLSAESEEKREVERIRSKPPEHFTKRNAAKNEAGFLAPEVTRRADGSYRMTANRSRPEVPCVGCGHPASHHRTGELNRHNAHQSRCAYKEGSSDVECPCQLHRSAALRQVCRWCGIAMLQYQGGERVCDVRRSSENRNQHLSCEAE